MDFPIIATQKELLEFLRALNDRLNKLEIAFEKIAKTKTSRGKRLFEFDDDEEGD